MYHKYTGIILKNFPLGETDELLTIYTREAGKLRVMARGVHRIKSRLAGVLQCLNEVEFETARGSKSGSSGIPILISARIKSMNAYLREDLKKFAFALVGVETLYRLTPDQEPQAAAYDELLAFLRGLAQSRDESAEVRGFQLGLLQLFGFAGAQKKDLNEKELGELLHNVLEREIKSSKFANQT